MLSIISTQRALVIYLTFKNVSYRWQTIFDLPLLHILVKKCVREFKIYLRLIHVSLHIIILSTVKFPQTVQLSFFLHVFLLKNRIINVKYIFVSEDIVHCSYGNFSCHWWQSHIRSHNWCFKIAMSRALTYNLIIDTTQSYNIFRISQRNKEFTVICLSASADGIHRRVCQVEERCSLRRRNNFRNN